jgi:TPR repeat protein
MRTLVCLKIIGICCLIEVLVLSPGKSLAAVLIKNNCKNGNITAECVSNNGIDHIYIYDEIGGDTYLKFMDIASQIPINRPFPKVFLNSRGGDPDYARQIGRILRLRSAEVEGRDMIAPENEPHCSSACVEIAAGGVTRNFVRLEVHKGHLIHRIKGEKYDVKPMPDDSIRESKQYYAEMGIDPELGRLIDNTTTDNEWVEIKYEQSTPLKEQLIYKLGFLMNEETGNNLAKKFTKNSKDDWNAAISLRVLANGGDKDAAYILGYRQLWGVVGEKKDGLEAIKWFRKSAEMGNKKAYHMLGAIYAHDPDIIPTDLEVSTRYYHKAAELGFSGSQNNLAWSYYNGFGVTRSIPEAVYWATRSAEQGEPFAYSTLAEIRFDGNGFPQNDIETLKWTILAVGGLPEGGAKEKLRGIQAILEGRMSESDRKDAKRLASEWEPLKDGGSTMRDKDDK